MSYTVMVASHADYQGGGYKHSEGLELAEAVRVCQKIVDEFLDGHRASGVTGKALFDIYSQFGDDPYIVGPEPTTYSSWSYALWRCDDIFPHYD